MRNGWLSSAAHWNSGLGTEKYYEKVAAASERTEHVFIRERGGEKKGSAGDALGDHP